MLLYPSNLALLTWSLTHSLTDLSAKYSCIPFETFPWFCTCDRWKVLVLFLDIRRKYTWIIQIISISDIHNSLVGSTNNRGLINYPQAQNMAEKKTWSPWIKCWKYRSVSTLCYCFQSNLFVPFHLLISFGDFRVPLRQGEIFYKGRRGISGLSTPCLFYFHLLYFPL